MFPKNDTVDRPSSDPISKFRSWFTENFFKNSNPHMSMHCFIIPGKYVFHIIYFIYIYLIMNLDNISLTLYANVKVYWHHFDCRLLIVH